ncbi:hypothetical protein ACFWPQ_01635 [Streptomyces sp. NPDC058464]|uniref:hypothetical protein n=1 Tax=Streptomyces sp. NPDC058464 TaxID=3346511 RepID=UPI00365DCC50
MNKQISIEDALDAFRKRHGEIADENVLLRAQVAGLERDLAAARAENEQLMTAATDPTPAGPDLATVPAYPNQERA